MASEDALRLQRVGQEDRVWSWTVTDPLGGGPPLWHQKDERLLPAPSWTCGVCGPDGGPAGALIAGGSVLASVASGAGPPEAPMGDGQAPWASLPAAHVLCDVTGEQDTEVPGPAVLLKCRFLSVCVT